MKLINKKSELSFDRSNWIFIRKKLLLSLIPIEEVTETKEGKIIKVLYFYRKILKINKFIIRSHEVLISIFGLRIYKRKRDQITFHKDKKSLIRNIKDIKSYILAQQLNKKAFSKYRNIYSGKKIYIVASGPSLNKFKCTDEDAVYIGINTAIDRSDIKFDFIFVRDFNSTDYFKRYKEYRSNCIKFFGVCGNNIVNGSIPSRFKGDNTYFYIIKDYLDDIMPWDISFEPLADFGSTVFSAFQFALYTNPAEICLVGCDCTQGYFSNNGLKTANNHSGLILNWLKFRDYIQYISPELKVKVINPVGLKGVFEDVDWKE